LQHKNEIDSPAVNNYWEKVSMDADVDRVEAAINKRMDDIAHSVPLTVQGQYRVRKIFQNSARIMENHLYQSETANPALKMSGLYLNQQKWVAIATQTKSLSKIQVRQIRYTMGHHGIPDNLRGQIWVNLLNIETVRSNHASTMYHKLCEFPNIKALTDIRKDVDRTMAEL